MTVLARPRRLLARHRRLLAGPFALIALAVVAGSIFFIAGPRAQGQNDMVSTNPADIQAGMLLYQASCQSCHGFQGEGGQTSAPTLVSAGAAAADFYLTTGRMPLNNPANQPIRHRPYFNPVQIRQLVSYINALPVITGNPAGPAIPTVGPQCPGVVPQAGCVTLSQGQQAFAINCAQCHHAAGAGGILSRGNVVPSLRNANLTQVAEAIRVGPRPMPVFGPAQMSNDEMSAIAHYVQYLHHPADPGGLGLGHFGPVAEGFVGVVIGFSLLWFAVRMIGTRG
jgi:ubiquinol-cytochrome c reductase cytochrome c subunit